MRDRGDLAKCPWVGVSRRRSTLAFPRIQPSPVRRTYRGSSRRPAGLCALDIRFDTRTRQTRESCRYFAGGEGGGVQYPRLSRTLRVPSSRSANRRDLVINVARAGVFISMLHSRRSHLNVARRPSPPQLTSPGCICKQARVN